MRDTIRRFVKICSETLPIVEPIYDFGSLQVPGQEEIADLRPFFRGKEYIGADIRSGQGVDVILDLHKIDLPSESVGTVLILDTLEHVEFPRKAIEEARRILKPNGILIISSATFFPIHDYPSDYWRFTPDAFMSLLKPFYNLVVDCAGERTLPHTVIGVGFKQNAPKDLMEKFKKRLRKERPMRGSWKELAMLIAPPALIGAVYRRVKKARSG